jgi:trans-aconitate methyltransferase
MYSFDEKTPTVLCEIMGRHKSDKGHVNILESWHNYTTFYYSLFKEWREKPLRLFELGIGTTNESMISNMGSGGRPGASLYGWHEFFPHAKIIGADIDTNILFETDSIQTFYCDQTNPDTIKTVWEKLDPVDIIIEDGMHTFHANVCFFEYSIHKLKTNGYYIIEDILREEESLFLEKIKEWERKYTDCIFTFIHIPSTVNHFDNTLLVVNKR